jgi:hypothetical protein
MSSLEKAIETILKFKRDREEIMQVMESRPCYAIDKQIWLDVLQYMTNHQDDIDDDVNDYGDLKAVQAYARRNSQ